MPAEPPAPRAPTDPFTAGPRLRDPWLVAAWPGMGAFGRLGAFREYQDRFLDLFKRAD
jgi:hypothetical protein